VQGVLREGVGVEGALAWMRPTDCVHDPYRLTTLRLVEEQVSVELQPRELQQEWFVLVGQDDLLISRDLHLGLRDAATCLW
jgi:hypothetical protein